jgi:hypothetical protein
VEEGALKPNIRPGDDIMGDLRCVLEKRGLELLEGEQGTASLWLFPSPLFTQPHCRSVLGNSVLWPLSRINLGRPRCHGRSLPLPSY